MKNIFKKNILIYIIPILSLSLIIVTFAQILSAGYGWNEKIGWVNFANVDLNIGTREFSGIATYHDGKWASITGLANGEIDCTKQGGTQLSLTLSNTSDGNGNYPIIGQCFSEQIGWVFANHGGINPAAVKPNGELIGNFWSDSIGWINTSATDIGQANVQKWGLKALVEFSADSSDDENTGGNKPKLLITGKIIAATTVQIAITGGTATNGTDYSFTTPTTVTIPAGNYDGTNATAIEIPLSIIGDGVVEVSETIVFTLSNPTGDAILGDVNSDTTIDTSQTYTINNDDAYSLAIVKTTDGTEPSTDTVFTITVTPANNTGAAITGNIAYTGTATNGTDYATGANTFSIANGTSTAVITLTTTNDPAIEGNESIIATLSNINGGATIGTSSASAILRDDEIATVAVNTNTIDNLSVNIPENGGTDTFEVKLGAQPATNVVLTITSNNTAEATVDKATLTFTNGNWNVGQNVTVTGVNDNLDRDDSTTITIAVDDANSDNAFDAATDGTVTATIIDDDTAGITASSVSGNTTESGGTATLTFVLDSEPTANVTIPIAANNPNEGVSDVASLTFTTGNWNQLQTVTITGVDDNVADGNKVYYINIGTATSADVNYNGINLPDKAITNEDNDVVGFTLSQNALTIAENVGTATFTVVLNTQPTSDVLFNVSSSATAEATISPATLTFTNGNWNTVQTVTVTGVNDAVVANDTATITVLVDDPNSDNSYDNLSDKTVAVTLTDDELDTDGDGVPDVQEVLDGTDSNNISSFKDTDGDGVGDYIENRGQNGGDGDGDGTPDSQQQNVSGAANPVTGEYTTLKAAGQCTFITENAFIAESSLLAQDPTAEYPVGLVDFKVQCTNPGESANVSIFYDKIYDTSNWKYKKYDGNGNIYADISNIVTFGTALVGSKQVTTVSFTVTDGDPNTDEDGIANKIINDPSGPAVPPAISIGGGGGAPSRTYYPNVELDTTLKINNSGLHSSAPDNLLSCVLEDKNISGIKGLKEDSAYIKINKEKVKVNTTVLETYPSGGEIKKLRVTHKPNPNLAGKNINFECGVRDNKNNPSGSQFKIKIQEKISTNKEINTCKKEFLIRKALNRNQGLKEGYFTDADVNDRTFKYAKDLAEQDIIHGDLDTHNARLNSKVARAEAAKIISRSAEHAIQVGSCLKNSFIDVVTNSWYHRYTQNLKEKNIIHGYSDGLYRPNQSINKVELYKIIAITFKFITKEEAQIKALEQEAEWFIPYVKEIESRGITPNWLKDLPNGKILTRGEVFTLVARTLAFIDKIEIK